MSPAEIEAIAEAGARVVLTSDGEAQGARAVQTLDGEGHGILYMQLDPADGRSVGRAVGFVEAALGRVDIRVHAYSSAAGVGGVFDCCCCGNGTGVVLRETSISTSGKLLPYSVIQG